MKKISLILVLAMIFTLTFASCGGKEETKTDNAEWKASDYSPVSKVDALKALPALADTIVFTPEENPLDDLYDYYFEEVTLGEGVVEYVYFTSAKTDVSEVGIFKVKDKAAAEAFLKGFEYRREVLINNSEGYFPEQIKLAENMSIGAFDDIVWFVATKDNKSVEDIIIAK